MTYVILVTVLIIAQYMFFTMKVGMARGKDTVVAPATTGDEHFERCFRVQLNTLEQMAVTLPMMWICATYFRADVAAILGAVFFVGRFLYASAYMNAPEKRAPGMVMGFLANVALVLCCLWAAVSQML